MLRHFDCCNAAKIGRFWEKLAGFVILIAKRQMSNVNFIVFVFSTAFGWQFRFPFGKVFPRCRQGLGKVLAYSSHTQSGLLSMPTLCQHYAKCGRRVWLRLPAAYHSPINGLRMDYEMGLAFSAGFSWQFLASRLFQVDTSVTAKKADCGGLR